MSFKDFVAQLTGNFTEAIMRRTLTNICAEKRYVRQKKTNSSSSDIQTLQEHKKRKRSHNKLSTAATTSSASNDHSSEESREHDLDHHHSTQSTHPRIFTQLEPITQLSDMTNLKDTHSDITIKKKSVEVSDIIADARHKLYDEDTIDFYEDENN